MITQKYADEGKLYFIDQNSLIVHVKSENVYTNIAGVVEKKFGTSNY